MPKPLSDTAKKLRGTYRASRSTGQMCVAEPVDLATVRCPSTLPPIGKKLWRTLAKELAELGTLARADLPLLETACRAYARAMQADAIVERDGPITGTADGGLKEHPAVRQARQWFQVFEKMCARLGIGATSRSSVRVVSAVAEQEDPWDSYFFNGGPRPAKPRKVG